MFVIFFMCYYLIIMCYILFLPPNLNPIYTSLSVCPTSCPPVLSPVCGTDGLTYPSSCILELLACIRNHDVHKAYDGYCKEVTTPAPTTSSTPYTSRFIVVWFCTVLLATYAPSQPNSLIDCTSVLISCCSWFVWWIATSLSNLLLSILSQFMQQDFTECYLNL